MLSKHRKKYGFYFGLTAAFLPAVLVILLIDAKFYAWLVLISLVGAIIWLRRTKFWQNGYSPLFLALSLILSLSGAYWGRPDPNVSFMGTLTRECARFALGLPFLRGGQITKYMDEYSKRDRAWSVPDGYSLVEIELDNCRAELISENKGSKNAIIYFHGGSFVIGNMNIFRNVALKFSRLCGVAVLLVDYRTAPEHEHPCGLLDAISAWDYLVGSGFESGRIILAGDSAGGNLALSLAASLRDKNESIPRGIICMSPWTDLAMKGESYTNNYRTDPIFGKRAEGKNVGSTLITAYAGNTSLCDSSLSPSYGDFHGFPPILLQTGSDEMLLSDSETVYKKALQAGVDARLSVFYGMFHGFQLYGSYFPESKAAWNEMRDFVNEQVAPS